MTNQANTEQYQSIIAGKGRKQRLKLLLMHGNFLTLGREVESQCRHTNSDFFLTKHYTKINKMLNKWARINPLVHKIRLEVLRGKRTAESFSR